MTKYVTILANSSITYFGETKKDPNTTHGSIWNGWILDLYPDHIAPGLLLMVRYENSKQKELRYIHCSQLVSYSIRDLEIEKESA